MSSIGNDDGDAGFQIAPMVDVVFVLMLFFMASAGSQVAERELNISLPGSKSPSGGPQTAVPTTPLMVDIAADGRVTVNGKAFGGTNDKELASLREFFKQAIVQCDNKDPVIIRPETDARHERIMDVLNAASNSGVKNLTFN